MIRSRFLIAVFTVVLLLGRPRFESTPEGPSTKCWDNTMKFTAVEERIRKKFENDALKKICRYEVELLFGNKRETEKFELPCYP